MAGAKANSDGKLFTKLLRLIVTQNPAALDELKEAQQTTGLPSEHEGGFFYLGSVFDSSDSCHCWFELEYFEFIKDKTIDTEMLDRVCENIDRGKCKHVMEVENIAEVDLKKGCLIFSTSLLHAAAAAGNTAVILYLTGIDGQLICKSSETGIKPFHIAAIKLQSHVLNHLINKTPSSDELLGDGMSLVKRDSNTGKLLWHTLRPLDRSIMHLTNLGPRLAQFLMTYNITDANTVKTCLVSACDPRGFLKLAVRLVINKSTEIAMAVLSEHFKRTLKRDILFLEQGKLLISACVLTGADNALQLLMSMNVDVKFIRDGYNMLDVAMAFGCKNCIQTLQPIMNVTPNIYRKLSPYNFFIHLTSQEPLFLEYHDALRKCSDQGFDVNAGDEAFSLPPLHMALVYNIEDLVKPLVELGADVDAECNGKTPLLRLIEQYRVGYGYDVRTGFFTFDLLKDFLYCNPSTDLTTNVLCTALDYDFNHFNDFNHFTIHEVLSDKIFKFKSERSSGKVDIVAETKEDRLLAVSAFAVLYDLGCPLTNSSCEDYINNTKDTFYDVISPKEELERDAIKQYLLDYISQLKSRPRTLKSSCRIAIRKAHPGLKLHRYLSEVTFPQALIDYITRPYILWPTNSEK